MLNSITFESEKNDDVVVLWLLLLLLLLLLVYVIALKTDRREREKPSCVLVHLLNRMKIGKKIETIPLFHLM